MSITNLFEDLEFGLLFRYYFSDNSFSEQKQTRLHVSGQIFEYFDLIALCGLSSENLLKKLKRKTIKEKIQ